MKMKDGFFLKGLRGKPWFLREVVTQIKMEISRSIPQLSRSLDSGIGMVLGRYKKVQKQTQMAGNMPQVLNLNLKDPKTL